jgi:hypothetical protein
MNGAVPSSADGAACANNESLMRDDIAEILTALGPGDHARPRSCHEVVQLEILPAIERLEAWALAVSAFRARAEAAEAKVARVEALHHKAYSTAGDEAHETSAECDWCLQPWPCQTIAALAGHEQGPPNMPGQHLCVACREPWPCPAAALAGDAEAETRRLRTLLADQAEDALEDVQEWGSYASDYFADKWDLEGCVAKWERRRDLNRAAISAAEPTR